MREKTVEKALIEAVKKKKGLCIKLLPFNLNGLPDRLCLLPGGRLFFVELKAPGKKAKKIQLKVHELLKLLGFEVYVIDNIEQIEKL